MDSRGMRYKVIDENGIILFEGYNQECINFITNNPHLDDIEKVSNKEYSRRFLNWNLNVNYVKRYLILRGKGNVNIVVG